MCMPIHSFSEPPKIDLDFFDLTYISIFTLGIINSLNLLPVFYHNFIYLISYEEPFYFFIFRDGTSRRRPN